MGRRGSARAARRSNRRCCIPVCSLYRCLPVCLRWAGSSRGRSTLGTVVGTRSLEDGLPTSYYTLVGMQERLGQGQPPAAVLVLGPAGPEPGPVGVVEGLGVDLVGQVVLVVLVDRLDQVAGLEVLVGR